MLPNKCRLAAYANFIFVRVKLLFYLLKNIEKSETVMVYHSLALVNTILLAKRIKKFKMILELNELYSDVSGSQAARRTELKMIEAADAFIFSNEQLSDILNHNNRPYAVEYGIYTPEKRMAERFDDGKIHVVYAGTFDPTKGGAMAAAAAAYLPENYHVHILGFGTKEQIEQVERAVAAVRDLGRCDISYDGQLDGEEFKAFIQKCHIGLSTQNPDAPYNATSFPSKILTYLSNGLQVVSIDIPAISDSKLSNVITFYKEQTPEAIANAFLEIDTFEAHENILIRLDEELTEDIRKLCESL